MILNRMLLSILLALPFARATGPSAVEDSSADSLNLMSPGLNWKTAEECGSDFRAKAYHAMADAYFLGKAAFDSGQTWVMHHLHLCPRKRKHKSFQCSSLTVYRSLLTSHELFILRFDRDDCIMLGKKIANMDLG